MTATTRAQTPLARPAQGRPASMVAAGGLALLVLAAIVALAWVARRPPSPVSASAPDAAFSAERASVHLARIAGGGPTPIGSTGSDRVRDHVVQVLSDAGLAVEVHRGMGLRTFADTTVAGRVDNVVATLPGRDPTGQVVLVAHYDTTFGTPGAADDKAAVAAMLEAARALTSGPLLRNDVVMVLTDGEEPGLLGASSLIARGRLDPRDSVVLNWEATGNTGPSVLFETSQGNAALIGAFAASAPHPVGDAAMAALYEAGAQNTDFTVFRDAGFGGLNFALIDGIAAYHHPADTPEHLESSSLQHHGANMLGLTRGLGVVDLRGFNSGRDATFFTVFGMVVVYPMWLVWPLAVVAAAAVVGLAVLARRRRCTTVPGLLAGGAAALVPMVVAPLAALGLWQALVAVRPGYAALFMGDPYRPMLYRWALAALTVTVLLAWWLALRKRIGSQNLAIAALAWLAALGVVAAALLPALSYYGSVPATFAAAGAVTALMISERWPRWAVVALTVGAAPGAVVLVVGGGAVLGVLGVANGAAAVWFLVLAGFVVLPLLELAIPPTARVAVTRRPGVLSPIVAGAMTLALVAAGLAVDRFDADHPHQTHLLYLLDADTRTARWVTHDRAPHAWVAAHTTTAVRDEPFARGEPPVPLPYGTTPTWTGPAEVLPLPAPHARLLDHRTTGDRTVMTVHVASRRHGDVLTVHVDRPVERATIVAEGHPPVSSTPTYPANTERRAWPYELRFYDPPADGVTVTLELRRPGMPQIRVGDATVGLARVRGFRPRPAAVGRSPDHSSDLVVISRTLGVRSASRHQRPRRQPAAPGIVDHLDVPPPVARLELS